jgi:FeS assembly SUF system regulator
MLRMTRLTDYAIMLLGQFAVDPGQRSARDLALQTHLPLPSVSKVLKLLARKGLLVAHRGVKGGFSLARDAEDITVAEVLRALEGPIGLTECSTVPGHCDFEPHCRVGGAWRRINHAVESALEEISLAEMLDPRGREPDVSGALSPRTIRV